MSLCTDEIPVVVEWKLDAHGHPMYGITAEDDTITYSHYYALKQAHADYALWLREQTAKKFHH